MKKFLSIIIILFVTFSFTACKNQDDIKDLSKNLSLYEINMEYNDSAKSISAKQKVNYVNNTDTALRNIKFHLYPQYFTEGNTNYIVNSTKLSDAYPKGISYADFELFRVSVNGEDEKIKLEGEANGICNVELKNPLLPSQKVSIEFEFNIKLPNCLHRFGYGENTINLCNFYPIACVYENGGFNTSPYNANGDPFYSDMANYRVSILLNTQYIVASTGTQISEQKKNDKKESNYEAYMVRDFAMVLSDNFKVKSQKTNNTLVNYYYVNDTNPDASLKASVDAIKTFSSMIYEYPYSTYSVVEADFVYGGMEYPNLVLINTEIENHDDYLNVIIHETAHQWWYGMLGNDEYKFPWLDEALTEFSTVLFYDKNEGYKLKHKDMLNASRENYSLFVDVYTEVIGDLNTSMRAVNEYDTEPEYTYCTYVKGVLMYESLYTLLGEKDFNKALKTYFENNRYKNATPDDLINSFSKASNKDLKSFFTSWLNGKVVIR